MNATSLLCDLKFTQSLSPATAIPLHSYYHNLPALDMLRAYKAGPGEIYSQEAETAAWYLVGHAQFIRHFLLREMYIWALQRDYWEVQGFCYKTITAQILTLFMKQTPNSPFKDEAYLFYIRTQLVPRCKHFPIRL
jgi:hypothetical protein